MNFETSGNMPPKMEKPKEFTREELFKIALHYIESITNRGSSSEKASRSDMKELGSQEGSYIEETEKKAWEMVDNGEAERIARIEYKGGVEKPKTQEEKDEEEKEEDEIAAGKK